MRLISKKIRERIITAGVSDWPRILPSRHRSTPAGAGFGSSRFSSPSRTFKVLYAAEDFATAFAEAVVRDRFAGKTRRYLYRPHLDALCITAISSSRELTLLDLTGAATYELGVDTDTSRARTHQPGQAFSEALHTELAGIDGILFNSRLTGGLCVAVYGRALAALSGQAPIALVQATQLPVEIKRLDIIVRRERGFAAP
ncbi:RES family NAD+ phosphorylase [Inquilinus sp. CA228]|uniref:RES family NAD+ phosphorylase n=1 Tax=Inquilinus sp. CA228 TaxID=3455609 RepID=UPI003F8CFC1F